MNNAAFFLLRLLSVSQFALWVDAVIFVFSLEDEISFQTVYHYFSRLAGFRNPSELPLVLVGTQGPNHNTTQALASRGRSGWGPVCYVRDTK